MRVETKKDETARRVRVDGVSTVIRYIKKGRQYLSAFAHTKNAVDRYLHEVEG